jgi:hypothetical protein
MGLDMYLHAERAFAPEDPKLQGILDAAQVDIQTLILMSKKDPAQEETYVYLSHWDYQRKEETKGKARYDQAMRVLRLAGLGKFTNSDSGGGALYWKDGKVWVQTDCAYWRKANQIHGWFVDNVQDGVDECQETPVSRDQLRQLLAACKRVLKHLERGAMNDGALELPPQEGFFFGSTDVDEWYKRDIQHTIRAIRKVLGLAKNQRDVHFSYRSSW